MKKTTKFSPEVVERAVRLVFEAGHRIRIGLVGIPVHAKLFRLAHVHPCIYKIARLL